MDIVSGLVMAGRDREKIFEELSADKQLKDFFAVDDEQIKSAIADSFFIFG